MLKLGTLYCMLYGAQFLTALYSKCYYTSYYIVLYFNDPLLISFPNSTSFWKARTRISTDLVLPAALDIGPGTWVSGKYSSKIRYLWISVIELFFYICNVSLYPFSQQCITHPLLHDCSKYSWSALSVGVCGKWDPVWDPWAYGIHVMAEGDEKWMCKHLMKIL